MEYHDTITLKDGRECVLRNGTEQDGRTQRDVFIQTHGETDYLLTYADETTMTVEDEAQYLREKSASDREIEILAEVGGIVVGSAGIDAVGTKEKLRHRAEFGISVIRECWGLGIGRALTQACVACARRAGYAQLELDVVAENARAIALYRSEGFVEYGRNPKGFRTRDGRWQELVLMRLDLD
ncbi:MAG: GNAT family N-acetyltransferase [Atopobiaceae bacterium]|nr:GNAT family N-acetyltransferase [Atopobiaceae bacterium]